MKNYHNIRCYNNLSYIFLLISYLVPQDKTCGCRCKTIQIVSEKLSANEVYEYEGGSDLDIESKNSISPEQWKQEWIEIIDKNRTKFKGEKFNSQVVDMDFTRLWEPYKKLIRTTNLNFKDLLGSYDLLDCPPVKTFGKTTRYPIYQKILQDGKKAYLYKNKFGSVWQVYNCNYNVIEFFI